MDEKLTYQFKYARGGLVAGLISICLGVILFALGITGSSSWIAKGAGFESSLLNAAPGVILFIVGLALVIVTRYGFNTKGTE